MKRLLVVAPAYCKPDSPTGQIERHFFPLLPKGEYQCTILCNEIWDYTIESDNCEIVRTHFNKWVDYACRFMFHTPMPYVGNVPDKDLFAWGKFAVKEAVRLAAKKI